MLTNRRKWITFPLPVGHSAELDPPWHILMWLKAYSLLPFPGLPVCGLCQWSECSVHGLQNRQQPHSDWAANRRHGSHGGHWLLMLGTRLHPLALGSSQWWGHKDTHSCLASTPYTYGIEPLLRGLGGGLISEPWRQKPFAFTSIHRHTCLSISPPCPTAGANLTPC